jgi:hypothetical protein
MERVESSFKVRNFFHIGYFWIKICVFFRLKTGAGSTKNYNKKFLKKINKNCSMLGRSILTREALIHSIPINEVKGMKNDVLRTLKASFSFKKFEQ